MTLIVIPTQVEGSGNATIEDPSLSLRMTLGVLQYFSPDYGTCDTAPTAVFAKNKPASSTSTSPFRSKSAIWYPGCSAAY
jgi:hypothetical protein